MECDSSIKFVAKSKDDAELFSKIFGEFKGLFEVKEELAGRVRKANELIGQSSFTFKAEDLCELLRSLDTDITGFYLDGDEVSFDLFPDGIPTDLCKMLFPQLESAGASGIECVSESEYGSVTASFENGVYAEEEDADEM